MNSNRLLIIDGNSIANRAFYGIMSSKMLMTKDGLYTNAIYGFLAILFKEIENLNPEYIAVAFDLKAPTHRHKMYDGYKATRHAMPEELAMQMPIIKEILNEMNIKVIEKEGYEADDILGIISKEAEEAKHEVTILSGDRDTFQLVTDKITVRIPRTKAGKTEEDDFDKDKIKEVYGLNPKDLIEVKGLMGDASDNIPGVPGVGEKTAIKLVKEYKTIDNLYKKLESGDTDIKGALKEKLIDNKELAILSRTLGTILLKGDLQINVSEDLKKKEWNKEIVTETFRKLNFNRFIERFNLNELSKASEASSRKEIESLYKIEEIDLTNNEEKDIVEKLEKIKINIINEEKLIYYFDLINEDKIKEEHISTIEIVNKINIDILKKIISSISIYEEKSNKVYYISNIINAKKSIIEYFISIMKLLFEDNDIKKIGYNFNEDYVLLKEYGITYLNMNYDIKIAGYILNSTDKVEIENLISTYLDIDIDEYINNKQETVKQEDQQINLFNNMSISSKETDNELVDKAKKRNCLIVYSISKIQEATYKKIEETDEIELFNQIEMPLIEVLADMQFQGIYLDKDELDLFGDELKKQIDNLTNEIYNLAGENFNINSHQQLGKILFEKLKLPIIKKKKTGYTTDVDVLEKLKEEHPIIEKILEYRTLTKLNSTYVEGLIPYINKEDKRIHSYFHQTITATGRISSTEPNLQNIPTRAEIGKNIRKSFKPKDGKIYVDADYSQIELRILANISDDKNMKYAFENGEDIHKQAASKVLGIPIEDVTKEERSKAKAVNFGIVYGISDFGLAQQIGVSPKVAKQYIEEYLKKYNGIGKFMDDIVNNTKEKGFVETLFHRRRYVPELKSSNYMVRQFGSRVAMNTPIQGTAADIMKIAMINVYKRLKNESLKAKLILQIHDELLIEVDIEEKERVKVILKEEMENAAKLSVPLEVEISEGTNWNEVK